MSTGTRKRSIFKIPFGKSHDTKQPDLHVVSIESVSSRSSRNSEDSSRSLRNGSFSGRLRKASTPHASPDEYRRGSAPASKLSKVRSRSVPVNDGTEWERDKATGEMVDHTEMLHSLGLTYSKDIVPPSTYLHKWQEPAEPAENVIAKLPPVLWERILGLLNPAHLASLALSSKAFLKLVGPDIFSTLEGLDNHRHKTAFLYGLDSHHPNRLLCYSCGRFHRRLIPGRESLKPTNILNPLFVCPYTSSHTKRPSRIRISTGRTLPFPFVQLATRSERHTSSHGLKADDLSRRYKDKDPSLWSHTTRFALIESHLYLRVISTCFPPPPPLPPAGQRKLLYTPDENYHPYFSVCPHWRDGNLMPAVKCALSHIPIPITGSGVQRLANDFERHIHPINPIVTLCQEVCRPMRRCPLCPTEYLIEIKMAEDRSDPDPRRRFKQALVVTRWSDLGDGSGPWPEMSKEWASLCDGDVAREFPLPVEPKAVETEAVITQEPMTVEPETISPTTAVDQSTATGEDAALQENSNIDPITTDPTPPASISTQTRDFASLPGPSPPTSPVRKSSTSQSQSQSQFDATFDPKPFSQSAQLEDYTYDSFAVLGKRAISGIFESRNTTTGDVLPGQRMVNMNPQGDHLGERGHGWY